MTEGLRVGFDQSSHPDSKMTVQRLAIIHDQGLGDVPRREILVAPTKEVVNGMGKDAVRATRKILQQVALK